MPYYSDIGNQINECPLKINEDDTAFYSENYTNELPKTYFVSNRINLIIQN